MIKLSEEFSIKTDGEGATLLFSQPRERQKIDKETKIKLTVPFIFNEEFHYQNVKQCLNKFLQLYMEDADDVKGVLKRISEVETIIKNIK